MAAASPTKATIPPGSRQKAKRLEQEAREDKSKQKTLERELEWMRQGQKARQAKSEGPDQRL